MTTAPHTAPVPHGDTIDAEAERVAATVRDLAGLTAYRISDAIRFDAPARSAAVHEFRAIARRLEKLTADLTSARKGGPFPVPTRYAVWTFVGSPTRWFRSYPDTTFEVATSTARLLRQTRPVVVLPVGVTPQ